MKICTNCGTEYLDNAMFCEKCGVPLIEKPEMTLPVYPEVQLETNIEKKKHKSALIGMLTLFLLCGVVATIGFFIIRSHQGYRQIVQQLQTYLNDREDSYWKYQVLMDPSFGVETLQEAVRVLQSEGWYQLTPEDYDFDVWNETYGDDWKVKIRILDVAPLSKKAIEKKKNSYQSLSEDADNVAEELTHDCMYAGYYLFPSSAQKLAELYEDDAKQLKKAKVKDGKTLTLQYRIYGKNGCSIHAESIKIFKVDDDWIFEVRPDLLSWLD